MGKELAKRKGAVPGQPRPAPTIDEVVRRFIENLSPNTRRAYDADLRDFAAYVGQPSPLAAVVALVRDGHTATLETVEDYKQHMKGRKLTPATVNRRLSALRSALKVCRMRGLIDWSIEVKGLKHKTYKDTAGPGEDVFRRMLAVAGPRDRAILRLLHDLGLRRGEVVSLDLEHLELGKRTLSILGKGRDERDTVTVPRPTGKVLAEWLAVRGGEPGPLFTSGRPGFKGRRLTGSGVLQIVAKLGRAVGADNVRPHGIRHTAITRVLELTQNVAAATAFARHASPQTTFRYVDNLNDLAGKAAETLAESVNNVHENSGQ